VTTGVLALAAAGALLGPAAAAAPSGAAAGADWEDSAYRGSVEVVTGVDGTQEVLDGTVFHDRNENSKQDAQERGIAGVAVSNGREVVTTDGKAATSCRPTRT
jgi:hypothetical protein